MTHWQILHPLCPHCYTNRKARTNRKGHQGYREPRVARPLQPWEIAAMRRPTPPPNGQSGALDAGRIFADLPELVIFLSDPCWDDGAPRRLGTITIFAQDGRWKVSLNDRDQQRFAILTGTTVEECLETACSKLRTDGVEWRDSEGQRTRRR